MQVLDDVDDWLAVLRHHLGWWPAASPAGDGARRPPAALALRAPSP